MYPSSVPSRTMKSLRELVRLGRVQAFNGIECPQLLEIEAEYKNDRRIPHYPMAYSGRMTPTVGRRIADAFDAARHAPDDEAVAAAYAAMAVEAIEQYRFLTERMGIVFEPYAGEGEPYADSRDMLADLQRFHMYFFVTDAGFGSGTPIRDSLMLAPAGIDACGYPLRINDVFRIVHDVFGHAAHGHGFGPVGEDRAWFAHSRMFTPLARAAITTETRGQNCWVNFGPHMRADGAELLDRVDEEWLPPGERPFADQKMCLLHESISGVRMLRGDGVWTAEALTHWDPLAGPVLSARREAMADAYRRTTYRVDLGRLRFGLRVDQLDRDFDAWCADAGVDRWAVITAANPYSRLCSPEENLDRNRALRRDLHSRCPMLADALGVPDEGDWPPEESLFAGGLSLADAMRLGRHYEQNAIVYGARGQAPALVWLDSGVTC